MLQQIIEIPRSERSSQIHAEQPLVWVGGQRVAAPGTGGPQARAPSFVAAPGTGGPQAHAPSFLHNLLSGLAAGGLRLERTSGTPASRLER